MNPPLRTGHLKHVAADRVFLGAEWQYLAMLNYEIEPRLLLPFVPAGTELDSWNGKVFVSLVGFRFLKTKLFGFLAIPMHANFEEVNLRFYVRRKDGNEVRRGVVFVRELVPRRAIAFVARTFYHEKYIALPMTHDIRALSGNRLRVEYRWCSRKRWNSISLEASGDAALPSPDSAEQFITEHYWGYAAQPGGDCMEYRVSHPTWKVWQARQAAFDGDAEDLYGKEIASVLRGKPHSAFLADGSTISVMQGRKLRVHS
jgi:uncharacterized protein YqjF (DUF2071 family)